MGRAATAQFLARTGVTANQGAERLHSDRVKTTGLVTVGQAPGWRDAEGERAPP